MTVKGGTEAAELDTVCFLHADRDPHKKILNFKAFRGAMNTLRVAMTPKEALEVRPWWLVPHRAEDWATRIEGLG